MATGINKDIFWGTSNMRACMYSIKAIDDGRDSERAALTVSFANNLFMPGSAFYSEFMYNMLTAIRYLDSRIDLTSIAYTTPNKRIYLNYDRKIKNWDEWFFVYCHECLHQLWDTFGVEDKLKAVVGRSFDHELLNYASDCVINTFLERKGLTKPSFVVDKDYIWKVHHVKYDFLKDDQASLYIKMHEAGVKPEPPEGQGQGQGQDEGQGQGQGEGEGKGKGQGEGQGQGQGQGQGEGRGQGEGEGRQGGNNKNKKSKYTADYIRGWNETMEKYRRGELKI